MGRRGVPSVLAGEGGSLEAGVGLGASTWEGVGGAEDSASLGLRDPRGQAAGHSMHTLI